MLILLLLVSFPQPLRAQGDLVDRFNQLSQRIDDHLDQPPSSENNLEVYLQWMGTKAQEREEVQVLLNQASELASQQPGNPEYAQLTHQLYQLWQRAQDSGNGTVAGASMKFIRLRDSDHWDTALRKVKKNGRRIYLKAQETAFSTEYPRGRSRCLLNFSLGDLESSEKSDAGESGHGGSLYSNRFLAFGYRDAEGNMRLPDRDFDVLCEDRGSFTRQAEGEPTKTIDWAFAQVGKIRDEAEWWEFFGIKEDAIDLMNEYYEDALCKIPPHDQKEGHKHFLELAREEELDDSIEHNEGFYGTLYGKVETIRDGVRRPADGAEVKVEDSGESWSVRADRDGNYEIKEIILHKECSPFDISAVHEGDWVNDTYDGPLEEPDKATRHEKNLLIEPKRQYDWSGTISLTGWKRGACSYNVDNENINSSREYKKNNLQRAQLNIKARNIEMAGTGQLYLGPGDMIASGSQSAKYEYHDESQSRDKKPPRASHSRVHHAGQKSFMLTADNLFIQIVKEVLTDADRFEAKVREIMAGGYDPEAIEKMSRELETLMGGDERSFPVRIRIQLDGDWLGPVKLTEYAERTTSDSERIVDRNGSYIEDLPLALPMIVEMKGTYIRGERENDTIQGQMNKTKRLTRILDKEDCPYIMSTTTSSLTLTRRRVK
ncbi:MAG: hypothetical protein ABFS39_09060 [Pseudomonadota bacterium]